MLQYLELVFKYWPIARATWSASEVPSATLSLCNSSPARTLWTHTQAYEWQEAQGRGQLQIVSSRLHWAWDDSFNSWFNAIPTKTNIHIWKTVLENKTVNMNCTIAHIKLYFKVKIQQRQLYLIYSYTTKKSKVLNKFHNIAKWMDQVNKGLHVVLTSYFGIDMFF